MRQDRELRLEELVQSGDGRLSASIRHMGRIHGDSRFALKKPNGENNRDH